MNGMRAISFALFVGVAAASGACSAHEDDGLGRNGIVFGLSQHVDTASGKTVTRAGYEYLELRSRGWSTHPIYSEERSCFYEELERRVGRTHVEGGVARFSGGRLPAEGLLVRANVDDVEIERGAFALGDWLTFEARGFAMPTVPPVSMPAPLTGVGVTDPPVSAAPLEVKLGHDLPVTWNIPIYDGPTDRRAPSHVLVVLETEAVEGEQRRGREVRCFFDIDATARVVPKELVDRLAVPGREVKGHFAVATHQQLTLHASGNWTIYVVASAFHREQPFVLK